VRPGPVVRQLCIGGYTVQASPHAPRWHIQHDGADSRGGGAWVVYPERPWTANGATLATQSRAEAEDAALQLSADALQWLTDWAF